MLEKQVDDERETLLEVEIKYGQVDVRFAYFLFCARLGSSLCGVLCDCILCFLCAVLCLCLFLELHVLELSGSRGGMRVCGSLCGSVFILLAFVCVYVLS